MNLERCPICGKISQSERDDFLRSLNVIIKNYLLMLKRENLGRLGFTAIVSAITLALLLIVRWKMGTNFLLFDRLFSSGGIWQIAIVTLFSIWTAYTFYDRNRRIALRDRLWLLFGILFFVQLLFGIVVDSLFLLSGKLHFPVPSVIVTGSIFRMSIGFMPILFLVTVLLSGGAWCSYLCYFGAFDSIASSKGRHTSSPRLKYRLWILFGFITIALVLRLINATECIATWVAALSGIIGILIILIVSRHKKTMSHCSYYCPLGTIVSYLKFLSPLRYQISQKCTRCFSCITICKYGALSKHNIEDGKPSIGCTHCGDCSVKCQHNAFEYRFLWFTPRTSELIFAGIVVMIYSLFLCVARV